jgi:hypothetical protein
LADGGIAASKKIGKDSFNYLIQVKGMSNLHSDERAPRALRSTLPPPPEDRTICEAGPRSTSTTSLNR